MKRPNPKTGLPFKRGDVREDGYIFTNYRYDRPVKKNGNYREEWASPKSFKNIQSLQSNRDKTKRGHLSQYLRKAKERAALKNLPFNLDLNYLESITTNTCPIFKTKFNWGRSGKGQTPTTPSLDRVIPEVGYVKGNVVFLCHKANAMKSSASFKELHQFADWVKETIPNE